MDDEEYSYAALQEPLYRVDTGNYEYRSVVTMVTLNTAKRPYKNPSTGSTLATTNIGQ